MDKFKIKEITRYDLSPCGKYKKVYAKTKNRNIQIITKSNTDLQYDKELKVYRVTYIPLSDHTIAVTVFLLADDFDEWTCEEYGQIIAKYFFEFEKFDNKHIYAITCIDGDSKKTAICLTETDAIAMFYSECIDREIAYEFTHDNNNKYYYENDDEDRFIKIWVQQLKINEWEEGL